MNKIFLFMFIFCLQFAQGDKANKKTKKSVELIKHSELYIDSLKKETNYHYDLQSKFKTEEKSAFIKWLDNLLDFSPYVKNSLFVLLIFIIVMFIIYKLAASDISWIFKSKSDLHSDVNLKMNTKNKQNDFANEIRYAMKIKDYKMLIHYYYLHILKVLNRQKRIDFQKDKTNRDYFYEIKDEELKLLFRYFTREFDHIYYGEFKVNPSIIEDISKKYQDILNKVLK